MKELKGDMNAGSLRLGIVVSRFNSVITEKLLEGAVDMIKRCGGKGENVTILKVPGSFEIPIAALTLAKSGDYDALICLGCLIRGETPHFDFLAAETTRGINEVALKTEIPISYGVLTTDTVEQALNRSGIKHGNKGSEAAAVAIEMANLVRGAQAE